LVAVTRQARHENVVAARMQGLSNRQKLPRTCRKPVQQQRRSFGTVTVIERQTAAEFAHVTGPVTFQKPFHAPLRVFICSVGHKAGRRADRP